MGKQIPIVDYLVIDDGEPHLTAWESADSGALYFDRRNADAKSGGTEFRHRKLATTGKVRSFTIVHRTVPGVPAPYVSALIDLDGGGAVKANLTNVAPDPAQVKLGMPVRLTTFVAGTDDDGTEAVAFAFEPTSAPGTS
ncbi:MAG TPA: OB-fold domain-containing protein [Acidimicrobiia bacterium]|nr:OB-fold domain-containing protein [Acidimicrobiia bacterium]